MPMTTGQQGEHHQIERSHGQIGEAGELQRISFGLLLPPGADALAYHRHHGEADGGTGDLGEGGQAHADGIGGGGRQAEGGHQPLGHQPADLEHTVLQAGGHPEFQDILDHLGLEIQLEHGLQLDDMGLEAQQAGDEHRPHHAGEQGGDGRPRHPHMKAENQQGVAGDVDGVHQGGGEHGDLGIAHGAVKRRPGVIDGQEGIGQGRPEKIHPAVVHHLRARFSRKSGRGWGFVR